MRKENIREIKTIPSREDPFKYVRHGVKQQKTTENRKLSMYGFSSVEGGHNIYALLEFDITNLRQILRIKRKQGEGGSLFSFFLKAIGKCLETFPEFNSMIDKRKTTLFEDVDISVPIEIHRDGEIYNKQYLLKNVNSKTIKQITEEIALSKANPDDHQGFIVSTKARRLLGRFPKWMVVGILRYIMRDHRKIKKMSGTIFVTSVSMFTNVSGYVIPYSGGPMASSFAIGSSIKKPVVKNNAVEIREIINITAIFNHDIIDGAPAARFINCLKRYIEVDYDSLM